MEKDQKNGQDIWADDLICVYVSLKYKEKYTPLKKRNANGNLTEKLFLTHHPNFSQVKPISGFWPAEL